MNKKQTAVQWLIENLNKIDMRSLGDVLKLQQQALQMEREQTIEFAEYCFEYTDYTTSYEDLYTQTYGECTQQ